MKFLDISTLSRCALGEENWRCGQPDLPHPSCDLAAPGNGARRCSRAPRGRPPATPALLLGAAGADSSVTRRPPLPRPRRRINSFLDSVDVGDLIVKGDLEAYSCEGV